MKKIWLWSSAVLIFQLAVFFGVAPFFAEQGRYTAALGIVSAATFVLLVAAIFVRLVFGKIDAVFALVSIAAFAGALALIIALVSHDFFSAVLAFIGMYAAAVVPAIIAASPTVSNDPDKPRWALLITALPLGVGAIGGGVLLRVFTKKEVEEEEEHCHLARVHAYQQYEKDRKKDEGTPPVVPWPGDDTPAEP